MRLETAVRTEDSTAAAVSNALYALESAALFSAASAVRSACLVAAYAVDAWHNYKREKLQQGFSHAVDTTQQTPKLLTRDHVVHRTNAQIAES